MSRQRDNEPRSKVVELLSFIASDLETRSDEQLEQLERTVHGDTPGTPTTFVAPNNSVLVHLHPRATREQAVSALMELSLWLDQNWDEATDDMAVEHARWPSRTELGPDGLN